MNRLRTFTAVGSYASAIEPTKVPTQATLVLRPTPEDIEQDRAAASRLRAVRFAVRVFRPSAYRPPSVHPSIHGVTTDEEILLQKAARQLAGHSPILALARLPDHSSQILLTVHELIVTANNERAPKLLDSRMPQDG